MVPFKVKSYLAYCDVFSRGTFAKLHAYCIYLQGVSDDFNGGVYLAEKIYELGDFSSGLATLLVLNNWFVVAQ